MSYIDLLVCLLTFIASRPIYSHACDEKLLINLERPAYIWYTKRGETVELIVLLLEHKKLNTFQLCSLADKATVPSQCLMTSVAPQAVS